MKQTQKTRGIHKHHRAQRIVYLHMIWPVVLLIRLVNVIEAHGCKRELFGAHIRMLFSNVQQIRMTVHSVNAVMTREENNYCSVKQKVRPNMETSQIPIRAQI